MTEDETQEELPFEGGLKTVGDIFSTLIEKATEVIFNLAGHHPHLAFAIAAAVRERLGTINDVTFTQHILAVEKRLAEEEKAKQTNHGQEAP